MGQSEKGRSTKVVYDKDGQFFDDGTTTFFWRAHTVLALIVITVVLVYVAVLEDTPNDTIYNTKRGLVAMVIIFILIGIIHMPDGPFVRPHPALWRMVLCVIILYVLLLIFILFQTADDARQLVASLYPELGKPLPERSYADECALYTPDHPDGAFHNFFDKMDVFVTCHLFGWVVKSLILRDYSLLLILSVAFELLEYTLEPQLPNFGECWWDHWILDFLVCNMLGLWLGMKLSEYFEMKAYHWRGLWKIPTLKGKLKRAVGQFTPYSWTSYQWGYTESFKRFCFVCIIVCIWMLQELNVFYLKTILWIPPNHSLNLYREIIYGLSGACAIHEMYDFLSTTNPNARIGRFSWLVFAALICETLIEIKFGWDILTLPLHRYTYFAWGTGLIIFGVWVFWHFTLPFRDMPVIGKYFRTIEKGLKQQ